MPAFLVALIPVLLAALRLWAAANLLGFSLRLLVGLGLSFYVVEPIVDDINAMLTNQFGVLPQAAADWVAFLYIDKAISVLISAYSLSMTTNFVLRRSS